MLMCPFCGGSSRSRQATLSLTRNETGLLYNCYRASCPAKGFISSNPSELVKYGKASTKQAQARPYKRETTVLPDRVKEWCASQFNLQPNTLMSEGWLWEEERQRIIMPIRNQNLHIIGHNARYWSDIDECGAGSDGPKSITYWDNPDCIKLHWPINSEAGGNLVLVEDQPSAIRLAQDYNCVALLGTHTSHPRQSNCYRRCASSV